MVLDNWQVGFTAISSHGILNNCVTAIDGWLCHIRVPSSKETPNVTACFSGHYQCYGLNVQAACDADCRFTALSVMCPGGTGDSKALHGSALYEIIENLPITFYVVGDNAYTLSLKLLIPYCGRQKSEASRDAFNFYLSQLRIRIEQAFGLLVTKWRVFKKPVELKLKGATKLIEAVFCLHNFCIDERQVKRHAVREAIRRQLASDGRRCPQHNLYSVIAELSYIQIIM